MGMQLFVVGYAYCPYYQRVVSALASASKPCTPTLVENHDDLVAKTTELCAGKRRIGTPAETSPQIVIVEDTVALCIPSADAFSKIGPDGLDAYIAEAVAPPVYLTHTAAATG